jgi:hypothetical protein
MRITRLYIENFRSIRSLDLQVVIFLTPYSSDRRNEIFHNGRYRKSASSAAAVLGTPFVKGPMSEQSRD